jgi:DNA-binding IclR family transcriptional regulator
LNIISSNVNLESPLGNGHLADWKFITNHAQVLLCIVRDQQTRLREIAEACGITERAAHRIVADLEEAGYISRERVGRRNRYEFHPEVAMRHPRMGHTLERDIRMGDLVAPLMTPSHSNGAAAGDPQARAAK